MNKIVLIGDVHGHESWKKIVKKHSDADKIVFVGDYFDAWHINPAIQIFNFKEILELKASAPDQVVLLIGNHDFHYTRWCSQKYGGYDYMFAPEIGQLLHENMDKLQVAWQWNNLLVTHAGVSSTWYENNIEVEGNMFTIADRINDKWQEDPRCFQHMGLEQYGNSPEDGPFWIRPQALKSDNLDPDIVQVVGHTQMESIYYDDNHYFIDTLPNEYLTWEGGEFIINEIQN